MRNDWLLADTCPIIALYFESEMFLLRCIRPHGGFQAKIKHWIDVTPTADPNVWCTLYFD